MIASWGAFCVMLCECLYGLIDFCVAQKELILVPIIMWPSSIDLVGHCVTIYRLPYLTESLPFVCTGNYRDLKPADIGKSEKTPVSNTIRKYIQACIARAFPIWLKENIEVLSDSENNSGGTSGEIEQQSTHSSIDKVGNVSRTVLARRAEHLVNAIYVLTGRNYIES